MAIGTHQIFYFTDIYIFRIHHTATELWFKEQLCYISFYLNAINKRNTMDSRYIHEMYFVLFGNLHLDQGLMKKE